MLFKQWATTWAEMLCSAIEEKDSYRVALVKYRIECLLSGILSVFTLIVLAGLLGILKTAILIAVTGVIIKSLTGGLHSSTPLRCAVLGAIFTIGFGYLAIHFPLVNVPFYVIIAILIFLNIIVWMKAPHETGSKPLTEVQKKYLAIFSKIIILFISAICFMWPGGWGINELFYGMLFQVVSLLDVSAKGMDLLDSTFDTIEPKPIF